MATKAIDKAFRYLRQYGMASKASQQLASWVRSKGLTQQQASDAIKVSRSYLSEILAGRMPGRKSMEKISIGTDGVVPAWAWFEKPSQSEAQDVG